MNEVDLTGMNFQRAHLALMERKAVRGKVTRGRWKVAQVRDCSNKTKAVVEAIAVAVGILLGVAFLIGAASCGMARGAAWEVGNYASQPAWND
jgi:hypothetical protein